MAESVFPYAVPPGGTTGQGLAKLSASDFDCGWSTSGGGGAAWGAITGTLAAQTDLQTALDGKQASGSYATGGGTATGTNTGDQSAASLGLGNVTNTSDANKPVSTAQQTALDLKAPIASPTFTGTVSGITKTMVGLGSVDNTTDAGKPVSSAQQTALNLKANLASPTFTGTVAGITKAMVGLTNVDDTTDAGKPVSTATQTALNLKAPIADPAFTGTTLTLANAQDVVINATTGSKIGQSGSKIGFFGVTPAVRPTAITQTYATASATHANVTQLAAPAGGTGATAGAYSTAANRDLMIASINAARTDIANVKQVLNQVIDQLQALGLLQ